MDHLYQGTLVGCAVFVAGLLRTRSAASAATTNRNKAPGGRAITQDCNACHTILAQDETNPKILKDLGLQ